jgi:acetyltransferase
VLDAAFERCGVLRVDTIAEVFSMAETLGRQPRPRGPRLSILTNAAPCGARDRRTDQKRRRTRERFAHHDGRTQRLSARTVESRQPIDILGDADARVMQKPWKSSPATKIATDSGNSDAASDDAGASHRPRFGALCRFGRQTAADGVDGWRGVSRGVEALNAAGIATFAYPDEARALSL